MNLPEQLIRLFFRGIAKRVKAINQQPEIFKDYQHKIVDFIQNEILFSDSSALQFGEILTAVIYTENLKLITEQIHEQYLSNYDLDENAYRRHDNSYLILEYKKLIRQRNNTIFSIHRVQEDYLLEFKNSSNVFKFDLAWQNGWLSLVKPVSFDLQRKESIQKKAVKILGIYPS